MPFFEAFAMLDLKNKFTGQRRSHKPPIQFSHNNPAIANLSRCFVQVSDFKLIPAASVTNNGAVSGEPPQTPVASRKTGTLANAT
jgi:hypothetical protein